MPRRLLQGNIDLDRKANAIIWGREISVELQRMKAKMVRDCLPPLTPRGEWMAAGRGQEEIGQENAQGG